MLYYFGVSCLLTVCLLLVDYTKVEKLIKSSLREQKESYSVRKIYNTLLIFLFLAWPIWLLMLLWDVIESILKFIKNNKGKSDDKNN